MTNKKLLKKAEKLAKWAKRHGYEHVDVFAIAPTADIEQWYARITATDTNGTDYSVGDFFESGELDE